MSSIFLDKHKPIIFNEKLILSHLLEIDDLELKLVISLLGYF